MQRGLNVAASRPASLARERSACGVSAGAVRSSISLRSTSGMAAGTGPLSDSPLRSNSWLNSAPANSRCGWIDSSTAEGLSGGSIASVQPVIRSRGASNGSDRTLRADRTNITPRTASTASAIPTLINVRPMVPLTWSTAARSHPHDSNSFVWLGGPEGAYDPDDCSPEGPPYVQP